jgi:hypothetical protein
MGSDWPARYEAALAVLDDIKFTITMQINHDVQVSKKLGLGYIP